MLLHLFLWVAYLSEAQRALVSYLGHSNNVDLVRNVVGMKIEGSKEGVIRNDNWCVYRHCCMGWLGFSVILWSILWTVLLYGLSGSSSMEVAAINFAISKGESYLIWFVTSLPLWAFWWNCEARKPANRQLVTSIKSSMFV